MAATGGVMAVEGVEIQARAAGEGGQEAMEATAGGTAMTPPLAHWVSCIARLAGLR